MIIDASSWRLTFPMVLVWVLATEDRKRVFTGLYGSPLDRQRVKDAVEFNQTGIFTGNIHDLEEK